jgi:hypothetical protein
MKTGIRFLASTILMLAILGAVTASAASKRASKYFELTGKVLKVDLKNRTLLVADSKSDNLYIVKVPEGAHFKITFGINMHYEEPTLDNVFKADRIKATCTRPDQEHYARLEDGRVAHVLIAAYN